MDINLFLLIFGLLIVGCILTSKISTRFSMPCLMFFLLVGLALQWIGDLGAQDTVKTISDGLSWQTANYFGTVALAFILFSGGYDSSLKDIKKVLVPGTILSTVGVLLTALLLGGFACVTMHGYQDDGRAKFIACCLLFGAIISSTDASAVFSILRSKKISLKGDLRPLLEYESGSNDPMATLLTLFFLGMYEGLVSGESSLTSSMLWFIPSFVWQMAAGVGFGILLAKAAIWLFNRIKLDYDGLYHVLGMGVVITTYAIASQCKANGFMAVYVAGIVMGNSEYVFKNSFGRYSDALAWLMQVILFTMLGFKANINVLTEPKFALSGLLFGLFLMFIARPVATFLCLFKSKYSTKAKTLISWVGLRGGAPIMLATFPMVSNVEWGELNGVGFNELMFNMIFFMVLLSVAFQSFTIMPLARLLKLDSPLQEVPTAPLSFDQVTYKKEKKGAGADDDDYADNRTAEFTVQDTSGLVDKELKDLGLPNGVFVLMVRRNTKYIVPRGNTVIHANDSLTVLGTAERLKEATEFFSGPKA
jgi:potassium/hydrogen antiporter